MLGENYRQLTTKTEIVCGSGKIIYFPQKAYPAETMLKADYVEAMKEIAAKAAGEETCQGWMEAAPSVGFHGLGSFGPPYDLSVEYRLAER